MFGAFSELNVLPSASKILPPAATPQQKSSFPSAFPHLSSADEHAVGLVGGVGGGA